MSYLRAGLKAPLFLLLSPACWTLLLLGCATSLLAAGEDSFDEAGRTLETVQVTATRIEAPEQDVSAAITSTLRDKAFSESPDVLPELLRSLPGVYFQQTTPGQGVPIIRGLKGSQVLHLVDGMRVNNAFFRDAPNQYLGLVDSFAIARTEVVRGASGSLYGADAMGGVVNFLTRAPSFGVQGWRTGTSLYGGWSSADSALVSRLETSAGNARHALDGGFSYRDHAHRRTGAGETIRPSGYRSKAADASWAVHLSNDAQFRLSVQVLEQPSTPRTDELVAGYGQQHPSSKLFEFMPNRRSFLHASYSGLPERAWLQHFRVDLARQVITDDRLSQDFGSMLINTEQNQSQLDGLTAQFDFSPLAEVHWSAGFDFYTDKVSSQRQQTDETTRITRGVTSRFPDQSTMESLAGWVSTEWQAGSRWTLRAGARYSRFDIHLPRALDGHDVRLKPDDLTGDFRFVYQLTDNINLVGNLGRGFRPPNIFDLGTLGNRAGNRFNTVNTDLRPESVRSFDLGLKTDHGAWQSELFIFFMDYRDKITSVETGEITDAGRVVVRSENLSEAEIYGLEAGVRGDLGSSLQVYATLNYTRGSEATDSGTHPADRIPPLNGKAGFEYLLAETLSLEAFLLFAHGQDRLSLRDATDPRINPLGTPGWGTLNLALNWGTPGDLQLGIRLENLTDKAYREHGSGIDAPGRNLGLWARKHF